MKAILKRDVWEPGKSVVTTTFGASQLESGEASEAMARNNRGAKLFRGPLNASVSYLRLTAGAVRQRPVWGIAIVLTAVLIGYSNHQTVGVIDSVLLDPASYGGVHVSMEYLAECPAQASASKEAAGACELKPCLAKTECKPSNKTKTRPAPVVKPNIVASFKARELPKQLESALTALSSAHASSPAVLVAVSLKDIAALKEGLIQYQQARQLHQLKLEVLNRGAKEIR